MRSISILLLIASVATAQEAGLQIPQGLQIPDLSSPRLIVPQKRVSAVPTGTPMQASVVVRCEGVDADGKKLECADSGTVIVGRNGKKQVVTCEHIGRRVFNREFYVDYGFDATLTHVAATVAVSDQEHDFMILDCDLSDVSPARVADETPQIGRSVISIGSHDEKPVVMEHIVTGKDASTVFTDGLQIEGRSGGGLFNDKGELVGVIVARIDRCNRSVYTPIELIRSHIGDTQTFGSTPIIEVEFIKAPFRCPPCDATERGFTGGRKLADGERILLCDGQLAITKRTGVGDWYDKAFQDRNPEAGYPFYRFRVGSETKTYYGATNADKLLQIIRDLMPVDQTSADAVPHEQQTVLAGAEAYRYGLAQLTGYLGDGATVKLKIIRQGAQSKIGLKEKMTKQKLFGTSGRIELVVDSKQPLPFKQLGFKYTTEVDKIWVDLDPVAFPLPDSAVFGASHEGTPKGSILMIGYTIVSGGYEIYCLFHPQLSAVIPNELNVVATVQGDSLAVDFGSQCPQAEADWAFLFGYVNIEYQRPLTGLLISPSKAVLQFHKSRIARDVGLPVK